MHSDDLFARLLAPPWPEAFTRLSALLTETEPVPWLAGAYHATLLCGALTPDTLGDEAKARPYQDAVHAFLSGTGLPDRRPEAVLVAARHLAPVRNASPYGHNGTFPYAPPYTLAEVEATLVAVETIPVEAGARREALTALVKGSATARAILSLWYTAAIVEPSHGYFLKTAPIQAWPASRVWPAIGGNPMGVPGPYYGNWAYPPPSPVLGGDR